MSTPNQPRTDPMEVLRRHIARQGLRMTRQRRLIAEVLLGTDGHVNIDELYASVSERDPNIGYATIYRTLKLLTECGLASAAHFGDGAARFEASFRREHHDHLICTECGKIIEFHNEEIEHLQEQVCRAHGFQMARHKMEIYGVCARCAGAMR